MTEPDIRCIINQNGDKYWYINGKLHCTDGPAIEYSNGSKEWYQHGKLHRTDGAAVELANGNKYWYINGERHRTDGPAIELANGGKYWYINGIGYIFKNWLQLCSLSHEEKCELVLIYG